MNCGPLSGAPGAMNPATTSIPITVAASSATSPNNPAKFLIMVRLSS